MNAVARLVITILFGLFGVHKFIDKKPLQGLVYLCTFGLFSFGWIIDIVSSIQFIKRVQIKKIESTSKTLGIIFALILLLYCFGSLGTEDFSLTSFIFSLISGIALIKIFVIDNKNHNLSYVNIDKTHFNQRNAINNTQKSVVTEPGSIRFSIGTKSYNDYDLKNTNVKYLTGKFYDENNIILDKYRNLKTPNYVLTEIKDIINNKDGYYYDSESVVMSYNFKDKYLNEADFFPYGMYWASINNFDEHQLKWYLYWRKEILNKNILDTDYSYILAFARELVCYTFNGSAAFNVSMLEYLYNSYKDLFPDIERYIPDWINDMLSEVGYFYNQSDSEIKDIRQDLLLLSLMHDVEKDKISISRWRTHYNERKSDLSNKQVSLIYDNQKYNNRFKKYAGLLAKYYIDNGINIEDKWFSINIVNKKERLFDNIHSPIERMQGTFKYKEYNTNEVFDHDMNQITKLCYDLIYPQNDMNENDYVISQYENGNYELPKDFFFNNFKGKDKNANKNIEKEKPEVKKEFSIDISKISNDSTKINFVDNSQSKLVFESTDQEFINMFDNKILDKKTAQQYCIKKGKMLNAYINGLNEKYFSILQKELIIIDDDKLRLNIEKEENNND